MLSHESIAGRELVNQVHATWKQIPMVFCKKVRRLSASLLSWSSWERFHLYSLHACFSTIYIENVVSLRCSCFYPRQSLTLSRDSSEVSTFLLLKAQLSSFLKIWHYQHPDSAHSSSFVPWAVPVANEGPCVRAAACIHPCEQVPLMYVHGSTLCDYVCSFPGCVPKELFALWLCTDLHY